jgi:hypothetical protein
MFTPSHGFQGVSRRILSLPRAVASRNQPPPTSLSLSVAAIEPSSGISFDVRHRDLEDAALTVRFGYSCAREPGVDAGLAI